MLPAAPVHIGTRTLRAELATHVRRAAAGHRIVITAAGRPIAVLGPVEDREGEVTVEALVAAGLVVAPRRTDAFRDGQAVPVWSGTRLDQALREVRG